MQPTLGLALGEEHSAGGYRRRKPGSQAFRCQGRRRVLMHVPDRWRAFRFAGRTRSSSGSCTSRQVGVRHVRRHRRLSGTDAPRRRRPVARGIVTVARDPALGMRAKSIGIWNGPLLRAEGLSRLVHRARPQAGPADS